MGCAGRIAHPTGAFVRYNCLFDGESSAYSLPFPIPHDMHRRPHRGFTIIELLVSIAVIAVLVALSAVIGTFSLLGRATVQVVGHMTHPGMTPAVATVTPRGPDVYDAALDFTMAGDWLLIATVRLHDGRRLEARVPVTVQPHQL